ncbi:MAG: GreA/GreB family elongation factor [Peptococcaceae bacterium]|nr:GreA/GreB family elongation factor [Peptococcaceae bacterium]
MTGSQLSAKVLEKIAKQLDMVKENRECLSQYPGSDKNWRDFAKMMKLYEKRLNDLLELSSPAETEDASVPFVVIGSEVEVYDLDGKETFAYRITTPDNFVTGENNVTLLSPVGKSLLLKKPGDSVDIQVPAGTMRLEIKSVKLDSEVDLGSLYVYSP